MSKKNLLIPYLCLLTAFCYGVDIDELKAKAEKGDTAAQTELRACGKWADFIRTTDGIPIYNEKGEITAYAPKPSTEDKNNKVTIEAATETKEKPQSNKADSDITGDRPTVVPIYDKSGNIVGYGPKSRR